MENNNRLFVHLFHIIFVGGLFLYVGIKGTEIPIFMFPFLKYLGIIIIIYHLFKGYLKIHENKSAWINYLHIFLKKQRDYLRKIKNLYTLTQRYRRLFPL